MIARRTTSGQRKSDFAEERSKLFEKTLSLQLCKINSAQYYYYNNICRKVIPFNLVAIVSQAILFAKSIVAWCRPRIFSQEPVSALPRIQRLKERNKESFQVENINKPNRKIITKPSACRGTRQHVHFCTNDCNFLSPRIPHLIIKINHESTPVDRGSAAPFRGSG